VKNKNEGQTGTVVIQKLYLHMFWLNRQKIAVVAGNKINKENPLFINVS